MTETSRFIAAGVWSISKRVLDGEETDSKKAQRRFHLSIRDEPATTLVELVNPAGEVIDQSTGAFMGPRSSLTH